MIVAEIIVSMLAAFGVFCLFKLIAEEWLIPDEYLPPVAVHLRGDEDADELAEIYDVACASWTKRSENVIFYCDSVDDDMAVRIAELLPDEAVVICGKEDARKEGCDDEEK